jgi:hypothetical protein
MRHQKTIVILVTIFCGLTQSAPQVVNVQQVSTDFFFLLWDGNLCYNVDQEHKYRKPFHKFSNLELEDKLAELIKLSEIVTNPSLYPL